MDLQTVGVQALVIAMMAAVGLELRPQDLLEGLKRRRAVLAMLAINIGVVPVLTWLLVGAVGVAPGLAAGLMLCAVAPAGPTGPLFARMARGDVGFGVAIMVLLGFVALGTAPLSMTLMVGQGSDEPLLWPMLRTLAVFQMAPLLAAMALRRVTPELAKRIARPASVTANILLLAIVAGLLATKGHLLVTSGLTAHLFAVGFVVAATVPSFWRGDSTGRVRSGSMVTSVRNLSVALLLSAKYFASPETDVAILLCGFWMMVIPGGIAVFVGRRI